MQATQNAVEEKGHNAITQLAPRNNFGLSDWHKFTKVDMAHSGIELQKGLSLRAFQRLYGAASDTPPQQVVGASGHRRQPQPVSVRFSHQPAAPASMIRQ